MAHQLHLGEWNAKDMHTEAEETTIWRDVIIDANRLILESAKIASYFRTPMITIGGNSTVVTRGAGLASAFKPCLRLL